jgi:hypothetical protein
MFTFYPVYGYISPNLLWTIITLATSQNGEGAEKTTA